MSDQNQYERNMRAAERAHDLANDLGMRMNEASARDAQEAIKIALLINGGAAVVILAFIAGIVGRTNISLSDLRSVAHSLFWFAGGIVLAGITAACAYVANSLYSANQFEQDRIWEHPYLRHNERSRRAFRWARFFNWLGFILAWISLALFIGGVFATAHALSVLK